MLAELLDVCKDIFFVFELHFMGWNIIMSVMLLAGNTFENTHYR